MGGGLMQLVAMGAQDVYLTGNPQITFFKVVYRRHTNFSKECIEQTFSGSIPTTGEGSVNCTLSRNGDLVQEIYLKITSHDDAADVVSGDVTIHADDNKLSIVDGAGNWVNGLTTASNGNTEVYFNKDIYVKTGIDIKLKFSKNVIYKVQGTSGLTRTFKDVNGVAIEFDGSGGATVGSLVDAAGTALTGVKMYNNTTNKNWTDVDMTKLVKTVEVEIGGQKIDKHYSQWLDIYNELFETSHDLRMSMANGSDVPIPNIGATNYIPLRFWFNRNPGLALPLIALQYHEVKINMTLDPVKVDGTNNCTISDAKLLVNYVYLDTDERRRFAQVSHEYLIEQVQHTGVESETTIDMNFNHPVKALFWTAKGDNLGAAKLQLNGHDRAAEQPADYYHLVQPYECGLGHSGKSLDTDTRKWGPVVNSNVNNNVGMYSFCLKPAEHQPSGTCNFSRIDNARLNLASVSNGVHLFAMNYNVLRIMSGMGGLAYSN
jgi:hypothetical protein